MLLKCFLVSVIRTQPSIFNKNFHFELLALYSNEYKFAMLVEDLIHSIYLNIFDSLTDDLV